VLNLSKGEARTRVEHATLLTPRRSLTGELLPPSLPATAAELTAGAISPTHVRIIAAAMGRIPDGTHPDDAAQAEQTLATPRGGSIPLLSPGSANASSPTWIPTAQRPSRSPRPSVSCGFAPELTGS